MAAPNLAARNCFFVNYVGTDDAGYNAIGAPWSYASLAAALAALAGVANPPSATNPWTIAMGPGVFVETGIELPAWVWITGSADNEGPNSTEIHISSDLTLHPNWSNGAARGGIANVVVRGGTGNHNTDFTMPAPASGNPSRVLSLTGFRSDRQFIWQATGSGDVLQIFQSVQDALPSAGQVLTITAGTVSIDDFSCLLECIFQDSAALPLAATINGLILGDVGSANFNAANNAVTARVTASRLNEITADQTGSGSIAISADAVSIPLRSMVSLVGTVTLTRISDAGGVGYSPTTPGNWSPIPATVQAALDELAAGGGSGGASLGALFTTNNSAATVTVSPTKAIWTAVVDQTGAAGNRTVVLDKTGGPVLGNKISLALEIPVGGGINVSVTSGAGGSVVGVFNDGNGAATANFEFVYGTIAGGFPSNDWFPISYLIPATT